MQPLQQQQPATRPSQPQRQAADAAGGQQLASLVGGKSPENLDALRQALQQLGAALDEQAMAGGQLPSTEVRTKGFAVLPSAGSGQRRLRACKPGGPLLGWRVMC